MHFQSNTESIWTQFTDTADKATVGFAQTWAELMEAELALDTRRDAPAVGNIARATMNAAGFADLPTLEYIKAVKVLGQVWLYGDELVRGLR